MRTLLLLMAQYDGMPVIPLDKVCRDFFSHLTPAQFVRKRSTGDIALPVVRMDPSSQKTAKGIHITDLAEYIDGCRATATKELRQLMQ